MSDVLVCKDEHGCHVRIDGQWWHNFSPFNVRCLLTASGFPNATAIVRDAPHLQHFDLDYDGRWKINGRHTSDERVQVALERDGLDDFAVETIMRIYRKCHEIERSCDVRQGTLARQRESLRLQDQQSAVR
jgi:hypothetical protein